MLFVTGFVFELCSTLLALVFCLRVQFLMLLKNWFLRKLSWANVTGELDWGVFLLVVFQVSWRTKALVAIWTLVRFADRLITVEMVILRVSSKRSVADAARVTWFWDFLDVSRTLGFAVNILESWISFCCRLSTFVTSIFLGYKTSSAFLVPALSFLDEARWRFFTNSTQIHTTRRNKKQFFFVMLLSRTNPPSTAFFGNDAQWEWNSWINKHI